MTDTDPEGPFIRGSPGYAEMVRGVRRRLREPPEAETTVEDLMTALRTSYAQAGAKGEGLVADLEHPFSAETERALDAYLKQRLKPPHQHTVTSDTRWLAAVAALAGAYVVISELNFKGTSTLTPILIAIGIGMVCLAAAHLLRHSKG